MKKIYKIIASISVFLIVLFVGVVLVVGNTNKKANAGVIVEQSFYMLPQSTDSYINSSNYLSRYLGISNMSLSPSYTSGVWGQVVAQVYEGSTLVGRIQLRAVDGLVGDYITIQPGQIRLALIYNNTAGNIPFYSERYYITDIITTTDNDVYFIPHLEAMFKHFNTNASNFVIQFTNYSRIFEAGNTIKPVQNIYDLENKNFCLLYLSDISGIATEQMRDEITINWGFIDNVDNTLFSEYAPTISAQNLLVDDDTLIRLGVPLNNNGSAMNYYDISQKALLSTIDSSQGGATATAHIYGIYIWRSENMIEWGLAEFDTTSTPTSGATMNYLTSTTRLYQYQNMGTSTMTCRLSVSSNFNFITIKNQEQVDVSSVNAVIRQGGFMPAWALYNWARGSHSGFTSGEQYGAAQYQQGQPGYNAIFQAGRQAGLNENIGTQNWFMKIFQGVDSFLNIRIFPNITFGVLLGIPFIISVVWFIIRSFRGGGGS